jgi:hypothetical protein
VRSIVRKYEPETDWIFLVVRTSLYLGVPDGGKRNMYVFGNGSYAYIEFWIIKLGVNLLEII